MTDTYRAGTTQADTRGLSTMISFILFIFISLAVVSALLIGVGDVITTTQSTADERVGSTIGTDTATVLQGLAVTQADTPLNQSATADVSVPERLASDAAYAVALLETASGAQLQIISADESREVSLSAVPVTSPVYQTPVALPDEITLAEAVVVPTTGEIQVAIDADTLTIRAGEQ